MRRSSMNILAATGLCLLLLAGNVSLACADLVVDLGRGPITVHVPGSYDPEVPAPLVMLLHGYSSNGAWQESYFQLLTLAEEFGFLYLYPDGTVDNAGNPFWNATDACCNFYGSNVDDSGYLLALIDEVKSLLNVDTARVHITGHSNGGFMSYRMACDHPETIASIASLAGATWDDPSDCSPASPVHVLQIHGTSDTVIRYDGGVIGVAYPGAVETVEQWAMFGGCDIVGIPTLPPLDLDAGAPGAETDVFVYDTGCDVNGSAELWRINGGSHAPPLTNNFGRAVIEFLLSHPKAEPTGLTDLSGQPGSTPVLLPATPNPFNPDTRIRYRLSSPASVELTVHDVSGRTIRQLASGAERESGVHEQAWDGRDDDGNTLGSGVYFVRINTRFGRASQKLTLLK